MGGIIKNRKEALMFIKNFFRRDKVLVFESYDYKEVQSIKRMVKNVGLYISSGYYESGPQRMG